jgi:hypothetical protein
MSRRILPALALLAALLALPLTAAMRWVPWKTSTAAAPDDVDYTDTVDFSTNSIILPRSGTLVSIECITGTSVSVNIRDGCATTSGQNRSITTVVMNASDVSTLNLPVVNGVAIYITGTGTFRATVK